MTTYDEKFLHAYGISDREMYAERERYDAGVIERQAATIRHQALIIREHRRMFRFVLGWAIAMTLAAAVAVVCGLERWTA